MKVSKVWQSKLCLDSQYNYRHPSIEINPLFLYFVNVKPVDKAETQVNNKKSQFWSDFLRIHRIDLAREKKYFSQPDHLFPYYLFASLIISVVIILIRLLTLYEFEYTQYFEFWYENGNMPCYAAIVVALLALMHSFQTDNMVSWPYEIALSYGWVSCLYHCADQLSCQIVYLACHHSASGIQHFVGHEPLSYFRDSRAQDWKIGQHHWQRVSLQMGKLTKQTSRWCSKSLHTTLAIAAAAAAAAVVPPTRPTTIH